MPVEQILVHISAAASADDDLRYRQMALACQDFQPFRTVRLNQGMSVYEHLEGKARDAGEQPSPSAQVHIWNTTSSMFGRESNSPSSDDIAFETAEESVPDFDSLGSSQPSASKRKAMCLSYLPESASAADAIESQLIASSLADQESSYEEAKQVKRPRSSNSSPLALNEAQTTSDAEDALSFATTSSSDRPQLPSSLLASESFYAMYQASSESTQSKESQPASPNSGVQSKACEYDYFTSSQSNSLSSRQSGDIRADRQSVVLPSHLPGSHTPEPCPLPAKSVIPPSPEPGFDDEPASHVTVPLIEALENLAVRAQLDKLTYTRDCRLSERGHWRVDIADWAVQFAWSWLETFIQRGRAGWGVNLFIEGTCPDVMASPTHREENLGKQSSVLKVYCWGEIIGHMYALLWIASRSQISMGNPVWVDADDEVVVRIKDSQ